MALVWTTTACRPMSDVPRPIRLPPERPGIRGPRKRARRFARKLPASCALFLACACLASAQGPDGISPGFINFETAPVHPLDRSPSGDLLASVNLPDGRVDIYSLAGQLPARIASIPVGVDPVSVRFRTDEELWVVNHISDTLSVIEVPRVAVVATLNTADGPCDVVFAPDPPRAFVSCAMTNVIQVFAATPRNPRAIRTLEIQGDRPKALTMSRDGTRVYAAIFESGNRSTILATRPSDLNRFPAPSVVDFPPGPHAGQNPPPNSSAGFNPPIRPELSQTNPPPRVGLVVKKDLDGRWMDDAQGDWTEFVSGTNAFLTGRPRGWDISDNDLAVIDTGTYTVEYVRHLMNICMGVAVNPGNGRISVIGTDAMNQVRFEPILNGVFLRVNLALISPDLGETQVLDLNPHLTYRERFIAPEARRQSIGDPRGLIWNAAGTRGYVAGMGSHNILVIDEQGRPIEGDSIIETAEGPVGLALDESRHRLYVLCRFANVLEIFDTRDHSSHGRIPLFDPTPAIIRAGRRHFYDTQKTSGLGIVACASCHVDGRMDRLAWDLGVPDGEMQPVTMTNRNFARFPPDPNERRDFHPMKGPMLTQTLQDIIGHEPFHWRGDRDGIEAFNGTFTNLQSAASSLTADEMKELKGFMATIHYPPNPHRTFSNTLPTTVLLRGFTALGHRELPRGANLQSGRPLSGRERFRQPGQAGCIHCHTLPTGLGPHMNFITNQARWRELPSGSNGERHVALIGVRRSGLLPFKIPSLRNVGERLGMTLQSTNSRSGFGFTHDGSADSLVRFLQDSLALESDSQTADLIAFLLCLPGSDLPEGSLTDRERPVGLPSLDAHAALGKQATLTGAPGPDARFLNDALAIVDPEGSRLDLIARATIADTLRGWVYDRQQRAFRSDRIGEVTSPAELEALASAAQPVTLTLVARGTGHRLGIDRDTDGYPDQTEAESRADPADPASVPVVINGFRWLDDSIEIRWGARPLVRYRLQVSDALGGAWSDTGAELGPGTGSSLIFPVRSPETRHRFFRVRSAGPP
jgi:DNA-binding beta-propeller fold protein YncE